MLEALTGMGLATSAGLNAYIPLLTICLLSKYTNFITLPQDWQWLGETWVITALVVLLIIECIADKIPAIDHVNDIIHTIVRPASGGLACGVSTHSSTVTVSDPSAFFSDNQWVPVAAGITIALIIHTLKALTRMAANAITFGFGAPIISTIEDGVSVGIAIAAIVFPLLVIVFAGVIIWAFLRLRRERQRRKLTGISVSSSL